MNFGNWGGYSMMNSGFGVFMTVFWLIILIDLILLGVWLWKQIGKK
jgi:uncharacterized membrane protein